MVYGALLSEHLSYVYWQAELIVVTYESNRLPFPIFFVDIITYIFLFLLSFQSNVVLPRNLEVVSNCYNTVFSTGQCQLKDFVIRYIIMRLTF
jgi:hypothetical protein